MFVFCFWNNRRVVYTHNQQGKKGEKSFRKQLEPYSDYYRDPIQIDDIVDVVDVESTAKSKMQNS